jgi:hypothetical protein
LEDAAPTFESLGQGVIEFDQSATVETVITMEEGGIPEDQQEAELEPKQDNTPSH